MRIKIPVGFPNVKTTSQPFLQVIICPVHQITIRQIRQTTSSRHVLIRPIHRILCRRTERQLFARETRSFKFNMRRSTVRGLNRRYTPMVTRILARSNLWWHTGTLRSLWAVEELFTANLFRRLRRQTDITEEVTTYHHVPLLKIRRNSKGMTDWSTLTRRWSSSSEAKLCTNSRRWVS